jgi:serine/threonine protein kinase
MSWQADTGASGANPGEGGIAPGRHYLRDLKTLGEGRYRIIGLAGKGGMSQVLHAYDTVNDRDVAIKVLSLDLVSEETFLARFKRESELMRDLNHPNILRAYDYGQESEKIYLVMSYFGGGTLKDKLNQGPLQLDRIDNYLTQIAAGLGYAHSRNIVHRDVKPSNVLIHHSADNLVLSDFGIARALSNSNPSRTGTIMGTPLYMAPEQFLDKVDPRSDIYSLGIVLYQMLCGEVPFKGDGIGFKHLYDQLPPLKTWGVNYDPTIEDVVVKALAKRPEARFQSVGDMALAFREAIHDFARRETLDSFRGVAIQLENATWNSLEKDPAVLPGQATLSELPVITPSQLKTAGPAVNPSYLEQTTPLSLQELQRFENEPLPFHALPQSFSALSRPTSFQPQPASGHAQPETTQLPGLAPKLKPASAPISRAYLPIPPESDLAPVEQAPAAQPPRKKPASVSQGRTAPAKAIQPATPARRKQNRAENAPVAAKKGGFKWWLLIFPLLLALILAALAFYWLNNQTQGGAIIPVTTAAVTLVAPTMTLAAATSAAATSGPANSTPTAPATQSGSGATTAGLAATSTPAPVSHAVIVFTSEYNDEGIYNIYSYDTSTQVLKQLTRTGKDSLAAWSPDGSKIVFQREPGNGINEIWLMDPDGSNQTRLLSGGMNPEFAHTSRKIVYVNVNDRELYTLSLDNGATPAPVRLTSTGGKTKRGPAFSYDDKKVAFSMQDDRKIFQVYTLDLTDPKAAPVRLTDFTDLNALWPQFSPDNTRLVFNTSNATDTTPLDIYLINTDGTGSQRLVGNTGHNSHPVWVADSDFTFGARIFFNSDRGPAEWARIYSMNPTADRTQSDQRLFFAHKQGDEDAPYHDYAPSVIFTK